MWTRGLERNFGRLPAAHLLAVNLLLASPSASAEDAPVAPPTPTLAPAANPGRTIQLPANLPPINIPAGLLQQATGTTPVATAAAPAKPTTSVGLRFDCLHNFNAQKGATQSCLQISGLQVGVHDDLSPEVSGRVRIDPFSTPRPSREGLALRTGLPTTNDTALGIVDDYALTWEARTNLLVAIQAYNGATMIPAVSGLSMANSFADAGWRQTALTLSYNLTLPTAMHVVLAAGDGEGQTVRNSTPQQFFGLQADAELVKGLKLFVGVANNGNDAGTEEYTYQSKIYAANCGVPVAATAPRLGHSTRRLAVGFVWDLGTVGVDGLTAGLGLQANTTRDLGKDHPGFASVTQLQQNGCQLDPDTIFPEQDGISNSVRRTTLDVSLNYRVFGSAFVGFDYTQRRINLGGVQFLTVCHGFTGVQCTDVGNDTSSQLTQSALTAGMGIRLADGLQLSLEYFDATYDKAYTQVYYSGQNGNASSELQVFNARLAYRWQ